MSATDSLIIRPVQQQDCAAIAAIYNYYIRHTVVTFEEEEVDGKEFETRVADVGERPWLVAMLNAKVLGYAYATAWKSRCAYRESTETSIYLDHTAGGKGIGTKLYTALLQALAPLKLHTVIGGVALPNEASIKLHENLGFHKVAEFEEVGYKFGKRINVGYWQRKLPF